MRRFVNLPTLAMAAALLCNTGCASWFINGGELAPKGYQANVLVDYTTEGTVPAGVTYHLVQTNKGEAMFERSSDGSGTLITNKWKEEGSDHFFCWVGTSHGYEYVIPEDRTAPGKKLVYPKGFYSVKTEGSVKKPDPVAPVDPVATLIPVPKE